MKRNYVQVAQFLAENFPELQGKITGGLYPVPPAAEFAANIISILQLVGIAWMVMGGDKLLRMVGFKGSLPAFYWTIQDNSMPIMIGLFLLAPQFVNSFSNRRYAHCRTTRCIVQGDWATVHWKVKRTRCRRWSLQGASYVP
jgi:hypothetical protein